MTRIFKITDGTTSVNFIDAGTNVFRLKEWDMEVAQLKGGGTYRDSPLVDGRRLLDAKYAWPVERVVFNAVGTSQNNVIAEARKLFDLMNTVRAYWINRYSHAPVWVEMKADAATNTDFALVYNITIPGLTDPMGIVFAQKNMIDLEIFVERGHIDQVAPTSNAVPVAITNTWNTDPRQGPAATTSALQAHASNWLLNSFIEYIFRYDKSLDTYSSNLATNASLPFDLFPASTEIDDVLYVGNRSTNPKIFPGLVFNLSTAASPAAGWDIAWEYYDGVGWSAFPTLHDRTNEFTTSGVHMVGWKVPADWAATSINSVNTIWARARVTAVPGGFTIPVQQTDPPYAPGRPHFRVASTEIAGDLPALGHIFGDMTTTDRINLMMVGMKSESRWDNGEFYSRIYISNLDDNIISTSIVSGADTTTVNGGTDTTPTGRAYRTTYTTTSGTFADRVELTIPSTASEPYFGEFRLLLRIGVFSTMPPAPGLQIRMKYGVLQGGLATTPVKIPRLSAAGQTYMDFGPINIDYHGRDSDSNDGYPSVSLIIQSTAANTFVVDWYEIVLLPTDEWFCVIQGFQDQDDFTVLNYLDDALVTPKRLNIESVVNRRVKARAWTRFSSGASVRHHARTSTAVTAPPGENVQYHLLWLRHNPVSATVSDLVFESAASQSLAFRAIQRYLGHRGGA